MDIVAILTLVIAGIAALGVFGSMLLGFFNRKSIQEIHVAINSRMDELLRVSKEQANSAGRQEERDRQKD